MYIYNVCVLTVYVCMYVCMYAVWVSVIMATVIDSSGPDGRAVSKPLRKNFPRAKRLLFCPSYRAWPYLVMPSSLFGR